MQTIHGHVSLGGDVADEVLAGATAVYARAFAEPPYHEGPERAERFAAQVRRYATEREGTRLAWATQGPDGEPVAMALGVIGTPGTWWRDRVAEHLTPQAADDWVGERCFEVVHLAVDPEHRRRGLGRLVLDLATVAAPAPTALLGCDPRAPAARHLYQAAGWQTIVDTFTTAPGDVPHWVMGKRLTAPTDQE